MASLVSLSVIACSAKATSTAGPGTADAGSGSADEPANTACTPLTPTANVVYQAVTADGHYVVVITDASGSHVFYGAADHMVEGHITGTAHTCADELDFKIDGITYAAVFAPATCNNNVLSRLVIGIPTGGAPYMTLPLTMLIGLDPKDAGSALSPGDLKYFCF